MFQNNTYWLQLSGMLGASPDGLVGKNALLEVKCPFTQRQHHRRSSCIRQILHKKEWWGTLWTWQRTQLLASTARTITLNWKEVCYFVVWTTKEPIVLQIKKILHGLTFFAFAGLLYLSYNPSIHYWSTLRYLNSFFFSFVSLHTGSFHWRLEIF